MTPRRPSSAASADYVMTVKGNMPTLHRQLKKLPWAAIPAVSAVSTDHGRRARRTIKAALAPAWIEFAGAAQVAQVRRTVTRKGKKTVEVVYLITSDRGADPGNPGRLDPRPLADREQAPLGPRRHLPGRQVPGQDRERAPRHGNAAKPGHQPPAPGRPRQYRRRQPPPRPRPAAHAQAASRSMNDFAGSLACGASLLCKQGVRGSSHLSSTGQKLNSNSRAKSTAAKYRNRGRARCRTCVRAGLRPRGRQRPVAQSLGLEMGLRPLGWKNTFGRAPLRPPCGLRAAS